MKRTILFATSVLFGIALIGVGANVLPRLRPPSFNGTVLQSQERVDDIALLAHTGERVRLSDFRGEVVVLYFGYTHCPDQCPATLTELAQARQTLGANGEDVQVFLVTVDPVRDTPDQLASYVANFDDTFIGLTGTPDEIFETAATFGIYIEPQAGSPVTGYLVDHTTSVIVIDRDGYMRLVYPPFTRSDDIASDLRYLLR